jgi:hypothetical protein
MSKFVIVVNDKFYVKGNRQSIGLTDDLLSSNMFSNQKVACNFAKFVGWFRDDGNYWRFQKRLPISYEKIKKITVVEVSKVIEIESVKRDDVVIYKITNDGTITENGG